MASQADLYNLALAEGLSPDNAHTAAAVGMVESSGNQYAHNTNASTGDDSYGYWQINMLGDLRAKRMVLFGITSLDQLYDPKTNAHAMKILSANGADFTPWSAYKSGEYKTYMEKHLLQTDGTGPDQGQSTISKIADALNPVDELKSVIETLNKTARWVSNSQNWLRVAYVAGGGVMILTGLVMITGTGRIISAVVPAGRAAKVAKTVVGK